MNTFWNWPVLLTVIKNLTKDQNRVFLDITRNRQSFFRYHSQQTDENIVK